MIPRTVYPQILKSIEDKPVTLITGARQTGKTYLCREISESKGECCILLLQKLGWK